MAQFTRLAELVDKDFTVQSVGRFFWQFWSDSEGKMLKSDNYIEGYKKTYPVITDKGQMDLGTGKLGEMLEAAFSEGKSDLTQKTFSVKSNGKSGKDVRYYLNLVRVPGDLSAPKTAPRASESLQSQSDSPPVDESQAPSRGFEPIDF